MLAAASAGYSTTLLLSACHPYAAMQLHRCGLLPRDMLQCLPLAARRLARALHPYMLPAVPCSLHEMPPLVVVAACPVRPSALQPDAPSTASLQPPPFSAAFMGEASKKSLGEFLHFIPTYLQQARPGVQFGSSLGKPDWELASGRCSCMQS